MIGGKNKIMLVKIRVLLGAEEDPNIDLTGYDLGTVRTLRDFEKYAGFNFKKKQYKIYFG